MLREPTLDCQDCGVVLKVLTAQEAQQVAANPYNYIFYCRSCQQGRDNAKVTKCPRCNGCGTTYRPPWIPGDQSTWSSTSAGEVYQCSLCGGSGLVPIGDGHHDESVTRDGDQASNSLNVAERNAFKEKLKSINFGRVPGGARD